MRVTLQSLSSRIQSTLVDLTARQAQQQARIATGQRLVSLADAPTAIADITGYRSLLSRLQRYQAAVDHALAENTTAETALDTIANELDAIHTLGVDALQIANQDKWASIAQQVLTHIRAIIDAANTAHGDIYVFSGTKNTAAVLQPTPPETAALPFELVTTAPTPTNPSGLEIRFKGNTEIRTIQTGDASSEQVSTTADKIFGGSGTAALQTLIELYNTLAFNADGTPRAMGQLPDPQQISTVTALLKQISDATTTVHQATSELGIRTERLTQLQDQLQADVTRQREFLSRLADTDVAQATMELQRDQVAYQYSLQISSRLLNLSLFDFLR